VTFDRTSGLSVGLTVGIHLALIFLLGTLAMKPVMQTPLLIEVTLAGTNAPRSQTEGVKSEGNVVAPQGVKENQPPSLTPQEIKAWQTQRRREMIKELAQSRNKVRIGAAPKDLRQDAGGLAEGRGAGEAGLPGSPKGTLSLTGAIATRGYKEPDFSMLRAYITEETQLRISLVVQPGGEVRQAALLETSGYPYVDQKALELCRKILFDPLPPDWQQAEQEGVITIKLKL
jgi:TonB family protein